MTELRDYQRRSRNAVGIYLIIERKVKQGKGLKGGIKSIGQTLFPGRQEEGTSLIPPVHIQRANIGLILITQALVHNLVFPDHDLQGHLLFWLVPVHILFHLVWAQGLQDHTHCLLIRGRN